MPLMNENSILTQAGSELQSLVWSPEVRAQKLAVGGQQSAGRMLNAEGNCYDVLQVVQKHRRME